MELSIVVCGSNDNYGGEIYREVETTPTSPFKERCRRCLFTIDYAFSSIDYEVIFVVWNEDPTRESLLEWDFLRHPRVRVVVVPPELAKSVESDRQFHETWAKNVGIRRAKSDVILCTNPDVLWLHPFDRKALSSSSATIAHRWTVNIGILDVGLDIKAMQLYVNNPAVRRNPDWNSNGDFTMMPKELWYKLEGLSTPKQESIAGVDMWQIERAKQLMGNYFGYKHSIWHVEHPGKPLQSGYGQTIIHPKWGFPDVKLEEWCDGVSNG